jgi:hypothetical protein
MTAASHATGGAQPRGDRQQTHLVLRRVRIYWHVEHCRATESVVSTPTRSCTAPRPLQQRKRRSQHLSGHVWVPMSGAPSHAELTIAAGNWLRTDQIACVLRDPTACGFSISEFGTPRPKCAPVWDVCVRVLAHVRV